MARLQAEEKVLSELVWISSPQDSETPATDFVTRTMRDTHRALFEEDDDPQA